ncbi:hypothetical protein AV530_018255 [Patagioenas fasciata monilis]|uniref:Uncharacterized protein n=1 Tax=Patagioenas fasciata monilis TaxID=372326 RepID=A0A1V4JR59_PATFA|nr:hypothetical protein AV530_018255 [Patagioenas fasciata monilis]
MRGGGAGPRAPGAEEVSQRPRAPAAGPAWCRPLFCPALSVRRRGSCLGPRSSCAGRLSPGLSSGCGICGLRRDLCPDHGLRGKSRGEQQLRGGPSCGASL